MAYLAGAMERAPDRGRGWRERLRPLLRELGHDWFDPSQEELRVVSAEERSRFREWKADGDARFPALMRRIIAYDLKALADSDYLIAYWDDHASRSGGTPSEITLMHHWGRPVYLVLGVDRAEVSAWVLGCASSVLESFDHLADRLRREFAG